MITASGVREAGANLVAALLFLLFAATHVQAFVAAPRASVAVAIGIETLVAALFLLRAPAGRASFSAWSWATSLGGTLAPLLLRPVGDGQDLPLGQVIQCAGGALAIASLAALNRSFGLLPALRPLRFGGPYRWVRHPIYAAYTIQNVGYLLSNASLRNLAVVLVALVFQVLRVYNEERVLSTAPEYARYMRETRWRLLPLVF